ncbi:SDR family oxidoreductase [uncultured Cohaesibacter sp.]|uniref:SDR family oxidoreductase n=1 Tax=uncultured Cohaesibacter sp. TaxID=1002546 RepID=UPI0029C6DC57|nr:SDR family oxidoreductase [uncultured Cohaesibacter sp.]
MKLFIFGYGYSARAIARELSPECDWVAATTRSESKAEAMRADDVEAILFDGQTPSDQLKATLAEATHVLVSIAPGADGDPVLNSLLAELKAMPSLRWIGYLSTVGVYGDHKGVWVDEETECRPVSTRSVQRVAAEAAWQTLAAEIDVPLGIYRLAGIYGPGRNQMIKLDAGTCRAINKPGQMFNRIHVDDIALAVSIAARRRHKGILNVVDDEPAAPQEVVYFCADLMGLPRPQEQTFEEAEMTPMARSFYGENKRCSNIRLHELIGGVLRYPTYREAFTHMWQTDSWQAQS